MNSTTREQRKESQELEKARAHLRALVAEHPEIQTHSASAEMLGVGTCPRWVPDAACDACMYCGRRFAVLFRRHHCRKCGALLCGVCTGYKLDLPELLFTKPVRVCVLCFVSYAEGRMDSVFFEESGARRPAAGVPSSAAVPSALPSSALPAPSDLSCSDTASDGGGTAPLFIDEGCDDDDDDDDDDEDEDEEGNEDNSEESRMSRKRLKLVRETVLAEQLYADELAAVCAVVVAPVRVTGLAVPAALGALLDAAARLEPVHRALLQALTDDAATQNGRVLGACFEALAARMDVYARYCTALAPGLGALDAVLHSSGTSSGTSSDSGELARVLAACEADARARGQSLSSLLARPAQRALRYPALISAIRALTPSAHPDHAALGRAAARLDDALRPVREQRRRDDARAQLARLAAAVSGPLPADLAAPGRTLAAQHALAATDGHRGGSSYPAALFVFNDALLICKCLGNTNSSTGNSSNSSNNCEEGGISIGTGQKYEMRGWVPAGEARVVVFADAPATPHCFEVVRGREGAESFRFFARDEAQKEAAVRAVKAVVNACRRDQLVARPAEPAEPAATLLQSTSQPTAQHTLPAQPLCISQDTVRPDDYTVGSGTPAVVTRIADSSASHTAPVPPLPRHWQPHCLRARPPPAWLRENSQGISFVTV